MISTDAIVTARKSILLYSFNYEFSVNSINIRALVESRPHSVVIIIIINAMDESIRLTVHYTN